VNLLTRKKRSSLPSTSELIPDYLSATQAKRLIACGGDSREIFACAARLLGFTEEEFLTDLAGRIGLPFAPSVHREALESPLDADYLRHGALPDIIDGMVVGAYCIDPYRLRNLLPADLHNNVVIVTWETLQKFEERPPAVPALTNTSPTFSQPSEKLRTILELIIDEGISFGLSSVSLTATSRGLAYHFTLPDAEPLSGLVEAANRDILEELTTLASAPSDITLSNGIRIELSAIAADKYSLAILTEESTQVHGRPNSTLANEKSILLIEDDPSFSNIVSEVLRASHYMVDTCSSIAEALNHLELKTLPHAVVSDLNVTDSVGQDTVEKLLSSGIIEPHQIVVLSNENDDQLEASLLRLGLRGVISKNRDPDVLLAYLEQITEFAGHKYPDSLPIKPGWS
jgi:CheY-like chemotaxis protein